MVRRPGEESVKFKPPEIFYGSPSAFLRPRSGDAKKNQPRDELPRGPLSPHPSGLYFDTHMRMAAQRSPESRPLVLWTGGILIP